MISRIIRGVRKHGVIGAVRASVDVLLFMPLDRRRRRRKPPSLREIVRNSEALETTAEALIRQLGYEIPSDLQSDLDSHTAELERRSRDRVLGYPERYAVEQETGRFLYLLTRVTKPETVVETGVANGASTYFFLKALEENGGNGRLTSIEIRADVGSLLDAAERDSDRWRLVLVENRPFSQVLKEADIRDVGLFFHDSDHSYRHQTDELVAARALMKNGAIIGCDDAEVSYAFLDAARQWDVPVFGLFDRRKLAMFARIIERQDG